MWQDKLLGFQHRCYRDDPWLRAIYQMAGGVLDQLELDLVQLNANRFFDGLTFALPVWERILGLSPQAEQTMDERRAAVRAKWLTAKKSDRALLQAIADGWQPGAVQVGFDAGCITVSVTADRELPPDLTAMLAAIGEAKPAHLPLTATMLYPEQAAQYVGFAVRVASRIRIG